MSRAETDWDQTHTNAAEIIADLNNGGGTFREVNVIWVDRGSGQGVETSRWACPCGGDNSQRHRTLARTVAAKVEDIDHVVTWLWVAGHKTPSRRVPPSAVAISDAHPVHIGRTLTPSLTICPRCRQTYAFLPAFFPNLPGMFDVPTIPDGGPQAIITPGLVNILKLQPGQYDVRLTD